MTTSMQLPARIRETLQSLGTMPRRVLLAASSSLDYQNALTVGHIQRYKLSERGPRTLGVISNRARSSATFFPARIVGETVVSSIGSNVVYVGLHERGFTGTVAVKPHARKQPTRVFGKPNPSEGGTYQVRGHSRKLAMPARRMFETGIEERIGKYGADLERNVDLALEVDS